MSIANTGPQAHMTRMPILIAAWTMMLAAPPSLLAQASRLSAVGTLEYAHITEDEGFLGAGLGAGGGLELHLTDATSLAVEVSREHHVRDLDFFAVARNADDHPVPLPYVERWEGTATFLLAVVSRTFGSGRARPAVWGGGGLMTHAGTLRGPHTLPEVPPGVTLDSFDAGQRQGQPAKALAMDGGFGVDVRTAGPLTVRPFVGFRLVTTGGVGPKYIFRSGARVAFRW